MQSLRGLMRHLFLIGVLICTAVTLKPASAQNTDYCEGRPFTVLRGHVVCSKHFSFAGTCDGTDQVKKWTVIQWNGSINGWNIRPWLNYPIGFIGVEIIDYLMTTHNVMPWFVGNSAVPDMMTEMAPNGERVQTFYQDGYSWPFPAVQDATSEDYVDLHGSCLGGGAANIGVTLYYTSQGKPPSLPTLGPGTTAGTWNETPSGYGRTISNLLGVTFPFAGFRFVAPPDAAALHQVSMSVFAVNGGGSLHAELWSDANGTVGQKLGQSVSVYAGAVGEVDWGFASPPVEIPETAYWMELVPESPGINIDWATVNNDAAFQSNRGATQAGMVGNGLPNNEQWKVKLVN